MHSSAPSAAPHPPSISYGQSRRLLGDNCGHRIKGITNICKECKAVAVAALQKRSSSVNSIPDSFEWSLLTLSIANFVCRVALAIAYNLFQAVLSGNQVLAACLTSLWIVVEAANPIYLLSANRCVGLDGPLNRKTNIRFRSFRRNALPSAEAANRVVGPLRAEGS